MRMDFLKMTMAPGSTIASYVTSIHHAAYRLEECHQAEEDDIHPIMIPLPSLPVFTARSPIISDLDRISVLLNGLPPVYQPVIVHITSIPLSYLSFEDVVTRLMNEEGHIRNITSVTSPTATPSDSRNEAFAATPVPRWKAKSSKSTPLKDASKVIVCHNCGGVGHIRPHCPSPNQDTANVAADDDERQTFTAIVDEVEEAW
jgi:hypothetical protein